MLFRTIQRGCRNKSICSNNYVVRRSTFQSSKRLQLMDAHTRPSHSNMFVQKKNNNNKLQSEFQQIPPDPEYTQFGMYMILLQRIVMGLGIVYVIEEYIADITICEGPSMEPTINPSGEIILIDKYTIFQHSVPTGKQREEIAREKQKHHIPNDIWYEPYISVTELLNHNKSLSLREKIQHIKSPLSVGDVVVAYHPNRPGTVCKRVTGLPGDQVLLSNNGKIITVPDGHVWLEGDNPSNSSDSRNYGPLPLALLQGRVLCRVWPLRHNNSFWMIRGTRPKSINNNGTGSTVLPAGYQGEHIQKTLNNDIYNMSSKKSINKSSSTETTR